MASVQISANRNIVTAALVRDPGETITGVNSWTWYKDNSLYAIHYNGENSDSIRINGTATYRVVCSYSWSQSYTYYTKELSSYGTTSFNPSWQYLMYDSWDVDYDTGATILGNSVTDYLQNLEGYYTGAGRQVDTVHIENSSYEYTQYVARSHTGTNTGTTDEHSPSIYVVFDPSVGNCFVVVTAGGVRSWVPLEPHIIVNRAWVSCMPNIIVNREWPPG